MDHLMINESTGLNIVRTLNLQGLLPKGLRLRIKKVASHNMRNCKAFYEHPKILIFALNGPVIGYPACLAAFADVVFSVENATFSTPFASLGLVAEGVSSYAFTQRLGMTKATEALVFGKRLSARELLDCGFFNKIFPQQKSAAEFHDVVLKEIRSMFSSGLDKQSMLEIKNLIRSPYLKVLDEQNMTEAMLGWRRFVKGIPQAHFKNLNVGTRKNNSSRL